MMILCLVTTEIISNHSIAPCSILCAWGPHKKILQSMFFGNICVNVNEALQKKHNDLATYYCSMKCAIKSVCFFSFLNENSYRYSICNCIYDTHCIQLDSTYFFNHKVQSCIQKMRNTQSLNPVISLLQKITRDYFSQDEPFIRETFLLLFLIHKQIFLEKYTEKPQALKTVNLNTILEISERINQLPIAEVLNAIDMLMTELPPFLEKYEFNSKISWKEWLKKYWWVPPIFGGWFALKILLSLQRPHYYFSPYLSSRPTIPLPPITTNDPVLAEIIVDKNKN